MSSEQSVVIDAAGNVSIELVAVGWCGDGTEGKDNGDGWGNY